MKRVAGLGFFAPVVAFSLIAEACGDTLSTTGPEGLRHAGAVVALPFRGNLDLQALGWEEPSEGRCPEGYPILSTMVGTGRFSHLGTTSAMATHCIDPVTLAFASGELTLVAANANELHGTYEGVTTYVETPMVGWADVIVFTGGTGRFVNAWGQAEETGEVNMVTGVGWSTVRGTLNY